MTLEYNSLILQFNLHGDSVMCGLSDNTATVYLEVLVYDYNTLQFSLWELHYSRTKRKYRTKVPDSSLNIVQAMGVVMQ